MIPKAPSRPTASRSRPSCTTSSIAEGSSSALEVHTAPCSRLPERKSTSARAGNRTGARHLRERLRRNVERFAVGLRALGLPAEAATPIFPVVLGAPEAALSAAALLRKRGLLVKAIRPPTVPAGSSRLRIALTAAQTDAHLDLLLSALREAA